MTGEQKANPYNARKEYTKDQSEVERGVVSANDVGVALNGRKEKRSVVIDHRPEEQAPVQKEVQTQVYSPVDYKKRYDDLKRHYDSKVNEWKSKQSDLEEQLAKNRPKYTPPKSEEELAKFKETNPDLFEVVETIAHQITNKEAEGLKKKLEFVEREKAIQVRNAAERELRLMHPDIDNLRQSKDFHDWVKVQPQEMQDWVYKNYADPNKAAKVITMYKAEHGQRTEPPKQATTRPMNPAAQQVRTPRAQEPVSSSPKVWTTSEIAALSISDYAKLQSEIMQAQREGRVIRR